MEKFRTKTGIDSVNPTFLKDDLTEVTSLNDIMKEKFTSYRELFPYIANAGFVENSAFMFIFGRQMKAYQNVIGKIRKGQTINVTLDGEWLAKVGEELCANKTYDDSKYTTVSFKGGENFEIRQKDCVPCMGGDCGIDAYDLELATNNAMKATMAFAKAFDLAAFTGKKRVVNATTGAIELQDVGSTMYNLGAIPNIASGILPTKGNIFSDLNFAFEHLIEQSDKTLATGIFDYLQGRNADDFVLLVSHKAVAQMKDVTKPQDGRIFNYFAEPMQLPGGYGMRYIGAYDGVIPTFEMPQSFLGTDVAAKFVDAKSFIGAEVCNGEKYMGQGSDVNFPNTEFYYKYWTVFLERLKFMGNYSVAIPYRTNQYETLIERTEAVTVTP